MALFIFNVIFECVKISVSRWPLLPFSGSCAFWAIASAIASVSTWRQVKSMKTRAFKPLDVNDRMYVYVL